MLRVVVVDDGSADQTTVARVALESGATLVRHPVSRGPAAARNAGLAATHTPFVAFVDSDVVPEPGWVTALLRHFDDPTVGIAAPRVLGTEAGDGGSWLHRYEAVRSSLDLGPSPALVRPPRPGGLRAERGPAWSAGAAWTAGFDESMRVAEDVDLVWRTVADGWRVRYEPQAVVRHEHRTDVRNWLGRKAFYGTGAALLAERHGDAVAPMVLTPWTAALAGTLLTQRWWSVPVGVAVYAGTTVNVSRRLRRSRRPLVTAASMTVVGAVATRLPDGVGAHAALLAGGGRRGGGQPARPPSAATGRRGRRGPRLPADQACPRPGAVHRRSPARRPRLRSGSLVRRAARAVAAGAAAVLAGRRRPTHEHPPDLVTPTTFSASLRSSRGPRLRNST